MGNITKINISGDTYDLSISADGTLNSSFISADIDDSLASSYSEINKVNNTDTNASIFNKITGFLKNTRYLNNNLGNRDNTKYNSHTLIVYPDLRNESDSVPQHNHSIDTLPVSSVNINSNELVPTSSLLYNIYQNLDTIGTHFTIDESFVTEVTCGGISQSTQINSTDELRNIIDKILGGTGTLPTPSIDFSQVATLSSQADTDIFFSLHNHENGWYGLKLGDIIQINDGTYNIKWTIAGFDCEYNKSAADNTIYDNGYGLCLVPYEFNETLLNIPYNQSANDHITTKYKNSYIHNELNTTVYNALKSVCGNHIINRNVLLDNTWSTAYLTLLSWYQIHIYEPNNTTTKLLEGNGVSYGEANYTLPLFSSSYMNTLSNNVLWSRHVLNDDYICTFYNSTDSNFNVMYSNINDSTTLMYNNKKIIAYPMMYLR